MPFGWTDRVAEVMAACDVVVTSSGYTCREARAVGRRLVLLGVVPGHGPENLVHELEWGDAAVASADPASIASVVAAVLDEGGGDPARMGSAEECEREWTGALACAAAPPLRSELFLSKRSASGSWRDIGRTAWPTDSRAPHEPVLGTITGHGFGGGSSARPAVVGA